jgi:uncharacterized NAD(P)/FAD-binding protein YdhS
MKSGMKLKKLEVWRSIRDEIKNIQNQRPNWKDTKYRIRLLKSRFWHGMKNAKQTRIVKTDCKIIKSWGILRLCYLFYFHLIFVDEIVICALYVLRIKVESF